MGCTSQFPYPYDNHMRRDIFLRGLFIVLLGTFIPVLAGVISYSSASAAEITGTASYYIFVYTGISIGSRWFVRKLKLKKRLSDFPFLKTVILCVCNVFFTGILLGIASFFWLHVSWRNADWQHIKPISIIGMITAVLITLVYEVLYLNDERVQDKHMVAQLNRRKQEAEIHALKNELDPHFMFNSLNTLSHLIRTDSRKAYLFNHKLAQVYKYFLVNKEKDLIPLQNELDFIEDYFYLLQLRHDNKLQISIDIDGLDTESNMIVPCALQIPVENAIKHNSLSENNPLTIKITTNGKSIIVVNKVQPKPYLVSSTHIGLKNLDDRYHLVCNSAIQVQKTNTEFIVKLPLVMNKEAV
jgi:sensor histidine kinase YesM